MMVLLPRAIPIGLITGVVAFVVALQLGEHTILTSRRASEPRTESAQPHTEATMQLPQCSPVRRGSAANRRGLARESRRSPRSG